MTGFFVVDCLFGLGFFFFSRRKNGGKSPIFIIADYKRQSCSCLSGVNTSLFHTTCVMVMLRW